MNLSLVSLVQLSSGTRNLPPDYREPAWRLLRLARWSRDHPAIVRSRRLSSSKPDSRSPVSGTCPNRKACYGCSAHPDRLSICICRRWPPRSADIALPGCSAPGKQMYVFIARDSRAVVPPIAKLEEARCVERPFSERCSGNAPNQSSRAKHPVARDTATCQSRSAHRWSIAP
jgi:hypothetical protein